jgi:hypothetical protein
MERLLLLLLVLAAAAFAASGHRRISKVILEIALPSARHRRSPHPRRGGLVIMMIEILYVAAVMSRRGGRVIPLSIITAAAVMSRRGGRVMVEGRLRGKTSGLVDSEDRLANNNHGSGFRV